jgi:hypothetical protein
VQRVKGWGTGPGVADCALSILIDGLEPHSNPADSKPNATGRCTHVRVSAELLAPPKWKIRSSKTRADPRGTSGCTFRHVFCKGFRGLGFRCWVMRVGCWG